MSINSFDPVEVSVDNAPPHEGEGRGGPVLRSQATGYARLRGASLDRAVNVAVITPRLEVRAPAEADRSRFVDLFCDDEFMVFSSGTLTDRAAHQRFDHMLAMCHEVTFAKQPVIERISGSIGGYIGVDWIE